jgi:prepilin-type N-terminal cleavage/methylation domain-containing protein
MINVTENLKCKKGFSLAEVVIAVAVVGIGIVAVIVLISKSIQESIDIRNQIIAAQLAQEGVELVRWVRDDNVAKGNLPFSPSFPSGTNLDECRVDKDNPIPQCSSSANHKRLNYVSDFYVHSSGGTQTKFQRKIEFIYKDGESSTLDPAEASSVDVTSIVVWGRSDNDFPGNCSTAARCISLATRLTAW